MSNPHFGEKITPTLRDLISTDDPHDPITAQFIPTDAENAIAPHERADPIGDKAHSPLRGIVHRYPDRALLKLTQQCAVHCRFCFRREEIGEPRALTPQETDAALAYIAATPAIWEVILTGGDPLVLSDRRLAEIITRLNAIPHLKIIRIHTRIPVAQPERITPELITALKGRCSIYMMLHTNHARELAADARAACASLIDSGIPLLGQSVLLRGVNDSVEALEQLFRAMVENRITPHYLHHGDLARGTAHFRTRIADGQKLMQQLRGRVSGLALPTYILDLPGGHGKIPLTPTYAAPRHDGWTMTDPQDHPHIYHEADFL